MKFVAGRKPIITMTPTSRVSLTLDKRLKAMESRLQASITDLARHMTAGFGAVKVRLDGVDGRLDGINGRLDGIDSRLEVMDVKLDAIMESTVVRKEVRNLVHELKDHGIGIDESKVFIV